MKIQDFFGPKEFEKEALAVAVPMMAQNVITSCVNLVDNVMVGQLGDIALSSVAASNRFYMIANFGMLGLSGAASIFLAQYFGAENEDKMKQTFRYMILSGLVLIVPMGLLGILAPESVLGFFTKDPQTIYNGALYLKNVIYSFFPLAVSMSISQSLRSIGETKIPFKISIIAIFTNALANYIFMFGPFGLPAFGIVGAAYGTVVARLVEMLLFLLAMKLRTQPFATKVTSLFHIEPALVKAITIKALPLVANELLWSFGNAMLFKLYATRGDVVMAGYSIATTTSDIFFTLFGGMAVATTVMVSQRLGAGKLEEGRRNGYYMIGFSFKLAILFAVLMFGASFVVPHFYSVSPESKQLAVSFLRVMCLLFWIYMMNTQMYFILRAGGEMKKTLLMDSAFMWAINIPVVASLTYLTGYSILVLYIAGQMTDVLKLAVGYRMIRKETWVVNLTEEN
ncbi:MAG: MATE family efflux transporter [Erysipelotrichaceae bacterium]|nr:MATE family efflux transporter [Erysipelotrichaceae bacterium]